MNSLKISICIPAFKRIKYLQRLLDSVLIQTFSEFEVIISDDTNDNSVESLILRYKNKFIIRYFKNQFALGTPENWNFAISKAETQWIKLMHDDDWFADENSLKNFYDATIQNPKCSFFFSAYCNVQENSGTIEAVYLSPFSHFLLSFSPLNLFKKQYIGNPSCTMIKKELNILYDRDFKWVVDFEFYIRYLKMANRFYYINNLLINVGINDQQVTKYTFRKPQVEIPENHLMIEKIGIPALRNIYVYDYYWRLYRNLEIRSMADIYEYYKAPLHPILQQMIHLQSKIPIGILKKGVFSKIFMFFTYGVSLFKKSRN